ncbi:MAG: hypothetical protein WBC22_03880 [Sedimentisphaerales bacterium]
MGESPVEAGKAGVFFNRSLDCARDDRGGIWVPVVQMIIDD